MTFKPEEIRMDEMTSFQNSLDHFSVKDIGQGRGGGYDREILLKKLIFLQKKSGIAMDTFVKIVKTFGIKFCLHGTRIKPDNRVLIDGKEYTGESVVSIFEFKKSGKGTSQDQLTPTRMSRMFATEAVQYARDNNFSPPMFMQDALQVNGLPKEYHFLAAIYAKDSEKYSAQLIQLGKNFDTLLADSIDNYDKKNGFGPRFKFFFDNIKKPETIPKKGTVIYEPPKAETGGTSTKKP